MTLLGFTLPPDSGEKLTLGKMITVIFRQNQEEAEGVVGWLTILFIIILTTVGVGWESIHRQHLQYRTTIPIKGRISESFITQHIYSGIAFKFLNPILHSA